MLVLQRADKDQASSMVAQSGRRRREQDGRFEAVAILWRGPHSTVSFSGSLGVLNRVGCVHDHIPCKKE
jgi:hypothetical protein